MKERTKKDRRKGRGINERIGKQICRLLPPRNVRLTTTATTTTKTNHNHQHHHRYKHDNFNINNDVNSNNINTNNSKCRHGCCWVGENNRLMLGRFPLHRKCNGRWRCNEGREWALRRRRRRRRRNTIKGMMMKLIYVLYSWIVSTAHLRNFIISLTL